MKPLVVAYLFALGTISAGCQASDNASSSANSPPSGRLAKQTLANKKTASAAGLQTDMVYADARQALLARHWTPVVEPECKSNVIGDDYKERCTGNSDSDSVFCKLCDELPELDSCSADGYCLMAFSHPGQILRLTTYGSISRWNLPDKSEPVVINWKIVSTPASH